MFGSQRYFSGLSVSETPSPLSKVMCTPGLASAENVHCAALNSVVINSGSPIMHQSHVKEKKRKALSLGVIYPSELRLESFASLPRVFHCSLAVV